MEKEKDARMNDLKIYEWREYERSQNHVKKPKNEGNTEWKQS